MIEQAMAHFTDDPVLGFAGYTIPGKGTFKNLYAFFHRYVDEKVLTLRFARDDENVIIDAVVRPKGRIPLTQAVPAEKDYDRLITLDPGEIMELPKFIHYQIENGKFTEIRCLVNDNILIKGS